MSFCLGRLRSQSGQSVLEMSLMFLIFGLLLFPVVEYSHYFYTRLTVRHALREAGRYAATGQANIEDPQNPGNNLSRPEAVRAVFDRYLQGFDAANLQEFTMTPSDGGGPGDTVTLRLRFNKPFFTQLIGKFIPAVGECPAGHLCFQMNLSWMNEPFPTGGST